MKAGGLKVNLVLSGGGIKGLAYVGVFEAGEKRGLRWGNIAGVSAGALAGAYAGAGYSAPELLKVLNKFDFKNIMLSEVGKKIPAVSRYMEHYRDSQSRSKSNLEDFLNCRNSMDFLNYDSEYDNRGIFSNMITFSKEGSLFEGDYLEEWVYKTLKEKGIKTFEDLRGGAVDKANPNGYKVRMTAVDATRKKVVVLPDDLVFYDIKPDKFEVAKAVRMSTSVPFAFKPVVLKKKVEGSEKSYHMVDGGVIDNFPVWLIEDSSNAHIAGFKLSGEKKKLLSFDTPLNVLQWMISSTHDIGVPKEEVRIKHLGEINTGKVKFLDFDLNQEERFYLYNAGRKCGMFVFDNIIRKYYANRGRGSIFDFIQRLFWRRY